MANDQWEYLIFPNLDPRMLQEETMKKKLNDFGSVGWEMVALNIDYRSPSGSGLQIVMKRRKN